MKVIDQKDIPEVSGGTVGYPPDAPCFPPFPAPEDYPRTPLVPYTDEPICPDLTSQ